MPKAPRTAPAATDEKTNPAKRRKSDPAKPIEKRLCPHCHQEFAIRGGAHFRACKFKALIFTEENVAPLWDPSPDIEIPVFASDYLEAAASI